VTAGTLAEQAAKIEAALPGLVRTVFDQYRTAADTDPAAARGALAHLQGLLRLGRLARAAAAEAAATEAGGPEAGGPDPMVDLAALLRDAPPELEAQPDD